MHINKKVVTISALAVLTALAVGVAVPIAASKGVFSKGNAEKYSVASTEVLSNSKLKGKRIIFLGSSVTYGSASKGESFADYLEKRDGVVAIKEAVSGTTLADNSDTSYISRLKAIDKNTKADILVCQLSTNDATKNVPLGTISDSKNLSDFDTKTVAGAIEYVIAYSKETFGCDVVFYTGTKYDSKRYGEMVELLLDIKEKWDIGVIDLWNSEKMDSVSKADYKLFMANGIHPTRAGYRDWWLPEFESYLADYKKQ